MRRAVEAWWVAAREDLEVAKLAASSAHLAASAFHCQQAAEKALRALLLKHHVEAREHSLVELLEYVRTQAKVEPPADLLTAARRLDPHYIQARYPGPHGPAPAVLYDDTISKELMACTEQIVLWAERLLESP